MDHYCGSVFILEIDFRRRLASEEQRNSIDARRRSRSDGSNRKSSDNDRHIQQKLLLK